MAASDVRDESALLSPSVQRVGIALAGLVLVIVFIYRGFPYEQLNRFLVEEVERQTGASVAIQHLGRRMQLGGPGVEAHGVRILWPDGEGVGFESVRLRPAWSFSWLLARPAIYAQLESPDGTAGGTYTFAGNGAFSGELAEVDLARLPFERLWPGASFAGTLDADLDLSSDASGLEGAIEFEVREGTLAFPDVDMAIPYEVLAGRLRLGGDAWIEAEEVTLEGPLLSAQLQGTIGRAPQLDAAPLRLEIAMSAQPSIRSMLQQAGLRVRRDGSLKLFVSGNLAAPDVR